MTSSVYFGAPASEGQIVSESVRALGLELLKIEPSKAIVTGGPTTVQPGFSVYKSHLPAFIRAADGENVSFSSSYGGFPPLPTKKLPIQLPDLVVTWRTAVGDEVRGQMRDLGFADTVVKGKPAMIKRNPNSKDVTEAINRLALRTSPCPENAVNINSLIWAAKIKNICEYFLAVHQYPAFVDEEHETEFLKTYVTEIEDDRREEEDTDEDMESPDHTKLRNVGRFRVSLPIDPADHPIFYDEHSAPKGAGLLFPYVGALAKFDRYTVPEVIKRYFFAGLGETVEECTEEFADLVSAWGNIQNSVFGNIMSHLYKVIDIAMITQALPIVIMTAGNYDGVFLKGWGYSIRILGKDYSPVSEEIISRDLPKMDSHANAFLAILNDLNMLEDARLNAFRTIRSIWGLKDLVDSQAVQGGTGVRDRILKNAKSLHFPEDRRLEPTGANIILVLSYISDPTKSLRDIGPLYPPFLFETDRLTQAWSLFGNIAPSFRVPSGKEMSLTKPFRITNAQIRAERGPQGVKEITKIGAILLPLEVAITHLKQVLDLKTVLNPFGNAVVPRSSDHISKEFEGEMCTNIVAALRKFASVTVVDAGRDNKRKDREEDAGAGNVPKKGKFVASF